MKHIVLAAAFASAATLAQAQSPAITGIVDGHVLPRFETLADRTTALAAAAEADCSPTSAPLRTQYAQAYDAWISASHLRFGPTEAEDRGFALAFWPDSRGATPRALSALIAAEDPVAFSEDDYREVSIAARGFTALEFLLFDATLMIAGTSDYHCALVQRISADIAATSAQILHDWHHGYADGMRHPGPDGPYRDADDARQEIFKALATGLQFTSEARLGRPLGSFDRPRPKRAEARRSGRSLRHVSLSLTALHDLAVRLAGDDTALVSALSRDFERALTYLGRVDDPVFASVAIPQSRLKVEILQQSVDTIRTTVREDLGPALGVAAGFNALDGD